MTMYHVNQETGRVNICKAQPGNCPLKGSDGAPAKHFEDKAEAKAYNENSLTEAHGEFSSVSKPTSKNPWKERKDEAQRLLEAEKAEADKIAKEQKEYYRELNEKNTTGAYLYKVTEANYDKAVNAIETANRKLEKAGIHDKFEYEIEEKHYTERNELGREIQYTYYNFTLNRPSISYSNNGHDYTFEAVISRAEAGYITRSAKGVDLGGWKPDNLVCDHCGQKRSRNKTYIVKDENGKRMQIGSACVGVFLGEKPAGLWALSYDPEIRESEESNSFTAVPRYRSDDILSMALAVTEGGQHYISKSRADETGETSTAERFSFAMFGSRAHITDPYEQEYFDQLDAAAARFKEKGETAEVIERLKNLEGSGDYIDNVRVLSNGEFVKPKDSTLLISGLAALKRIDREKERQEQVEKQKAKKIAEFSSGHYGEVGSKVEKGTVLKLYGTRDYTDTDYFGNPITKTVVTARDEEGHMITWFTGVEINEEPGDDIVISSGKVKKHGQYQNIDQTTLSNVRLMKKK